VIALLNVHHLVDAGRNAKRFVIFAMLEQRVGVVLVHHALTAIVGAEKADTPIKDVMPVVRRFALGQNRAILAAFHELHAGRKPVDLFEENISLLDLILVHGFCLSGV
jgi:hypothetical protein